MKKLITLSLLLLTALTTNAQVEILKLNNDTYFTLDKYKTTFHYRYTSTDSIPSIVTTNMNLLFGGATLTADVTVLDGWIVLKRIKAVQSTNILSNAGINLNIEDVFYKSNGKQYKTRALSKRGKNWATQLIKLIRQY